MRAMITHTMKATSLCLILYFLRSQSYVILESCPPGCECFERNTAIECKEAHLSTFPVMKFASDVKRLVLRRNAIENVYEDELKRYPNLEYLDLRDNEISTLSGSVFSHNPHLKGINLGLNPFVCDCDLQDISEILHKFKKNGSVMLYDSEVTNCAAPLAFVGRLVVEIVFQDEYNKKRKKQRMYIGETENRGIAICPKEPRKHGPPKHARLRVKPAASTPNTPEHAVHRTNSSPNYALIIATVLAAILVTCISLATAIKYYLKKKRLQGSPSSPEASPLSRKNPETFSEKIKQQRRASRGYAASDDSSDEETGLKTSYFKTKLKEQRRYSKGYTRMHATSGSASDLEDIALGE